MCRWVGHAVGEESWTDEKRNETMREQVKETCHKVMAKRATYITLPDTLLRNAFNRLERECIMLSYISRCE